MYQSIKIRNVGSTFLLFILIIGLTIPILAQNQDKGKKPKNINKPVNSKESSTDLYLQGNNIIVKFEGKNPHAKFFLSKYNNSEKVFYKIMFKSLVELDSAGKQANPSTHSYGLESQSFQSNITSEDHTYGQMIKISFTTTLNIDNTNVLVIFHFYIFGYDKTTTISGSQDTTTKTNATTTTTTTTQMETVSIKAATEVKFDVEIHNWPFLSSSNKLELGVRLISIHKIKTTSVDKNESQQVTTTTNIESTEGGKPKGDEEKSYMVLPSTAIADGKEVQIESIYKSQGNLDHIFLTFPHFNNSLYYDPVLGIGHSSSESSLLLYGIVVGIVLLVAVVVISRVKK